MSPLRKYYYILKYFGPRFVGQRAWIHLLHAVGMTRRRFKPRPWDQIDLSLILQPGTPTDAVDYAKFKRDNLPAFLFPLGEPPSAVELSQFAGGDRKPPLVERVKLLVGDRCIYFFNSPSPEAIDWHRNPLDDKHSDPDRIWCDLPDFHPGQGDPRMLWEPSRAAWAIDLARGRARGFEDASGELFWRWVNSWMAANPPFVGFQWKCGQEASVRMIALAFGFWAFANGAATTPDRWVQFAKLAWATGHRVAGHLKYALSQKNNHALSEACGLLLISQLFAEFRQSTRWEAIGRKVLAREIRRQTYDDGSYLQHSMNYHRVMLHTAILGFRLAELAGRPFERDLYERIGRCGEFLFQMMDPDTGRVPNYGHNDGANVLPLSECDFTDFRPVVQATNYLTTRKRLLPPGPWDEDLIWLFGPEATEREIDGPPKPVSSAFESGGYYTLRRSNGWAMIRCHTYRDRPSQCDPLHVDLWWQGLNILQDCGTYRYYLPGRQDLERYFKSIRGHNTIEVDGRDPVELVSRYLWLPWPRATRRHFERRGLPAIWFEGEHHDYEHRARGVLHRRAVIGLAADVWVIVDDLLGPGEHTATLRWHMLDADYGVDSVQSTVRLRTSAGDLAVGIGSQPTTPTRFEVVYGRDRRESVQGFASPYYGQREPIPTLEVDVSFMHGQRLVTVVRPGDEAGARLIDQAGDRQRWELGGGEDRWVVELARPHRAAPRMLLDQRAVEDDPMS